MNQNKPSNNKNASALIAVIITIAILSLLAGAFVSTVNNRRMTLSQGSTWQEALVAAEAGAHQGIAQVEQGVFQNSLPDSTGAGVGSNSLTLSHGGEGSTTVSANYSLTRTYYPVNGIPAPGAPYYRIVSTGTVGLPGSKSLSTDSRDAVLRKLNLRTNSRTATRTVETWLQPVYSSTGSAGLRTDDWIDANNHNIFVDSFDSTLLSRSYGGVLPGQPYPADNQNNGMGYYNVAPYDFLAANVSTNGDTLNAGSAWIYGDVYTNGGTLETVEGTGNIQGQLYDDYYEEMPPVYPPTGTFTSGITITTTNKSGKTQTKTGVRDVKTSATITGGTLSSPARYEVDSIQLNGGSQITFAQGQKTDNVSYVELYVTGDFDTKGGGNTTTGSVVINNGVNVKIYFGGDMEVGGNGLVNLNSNAASLSIYGINPPDGSDQTFSVRGSATFYGTVYAPGADLILGGGGNCGEFVGSLAGNTATLNGNVQIRYDESLAKAAQKILSSFKIATWFEDSSKNALLNDL